MEQYTQPIPKLPAGTARQVDTQDHTLIIRQLQAQLDLQDRQLRRLAQDLQVLREWISKNS